MTNTNSTRRPLWLALLEAISAAALAAGGDFYATERATARFCTESLVDACMYLPAADHDRHDRRANAVYRLTTWANKERLAAWSRQWRAEQDARAARARELAGSYCELAGVVS